MSLLHELSAAGVATGTSSLVLQGKSYQELRTAIDLDIERMEESITYLQESLSEVVLQNCHSIDLLLIQQEGLCADLREECYFTATTQRWLKILCQRY